LCLLLTLLAIPVFYQLFDDVTDRSRRQRLLSWFGRMKEAWRVRQRPVVPENSSAVVTEPAENG
jgi:hypothetical protein